MKHILLFLLFTGMLFAQQNNSSTNDLRVLTVDQRLDVAMSNSMSYMIMGLSYAKSLGKTPEEFAVYSARLAAPLYKFLEGKPPIELIKAMYMVQQTDKNFYLKITESSDSLLKGEMNLFGIENIRAARGAGGISVEDCYSFYNKFVQTISSVVGLKYEYDIAGDVIEFQLAER